jgi:fibronectin type 3 domain-containing protein
MRRISRFVVFVLVTFALGSVSLATRVDAATSNVSLAWDASTSVDVIGYRVYQSTMSGVYDKATDKKCDVVAAAKTCTISGLADGRYYWVATAYDSAGNESDFSNEVSKLMDTTAPSAPGNCRIVP